MVDAVAGGHVKAVIRALDDVEPGAAAKPLDHGAEKVEISQLIAGALEKQHRNADAREMARARVARAACRMKREAEEDQFPDAQRLQRLGLARHAAAEGFAAGKQRQSGGLALRFGHSGPNGGMGERRRIRSATALLHIGELKAQRRNGLFGKRCGNAGKKGMIHAGTGAMRKDEAGPASFRNRQEAGHPMLVVDGDCQISDRPSRIIAS
jgi:hypothetical protein